MANEKKLTVKKFNELKKEVTVFTNPLTALVDKINIHFNGTVFYKEDPDLKVLSREKFVEFKRNALKSANSANNDVVVLTVDYDPILVESLNNFFNVN